MSRVWMCLFVLPFPLFMLPLSSGAQSGSTSWQLELGFGYETVAQAFWLDSIVGTDTLDIVSQQQTSYLDDFRTSLILRSPRDERRYRLTARVEATDAFARARADLSWTLRSGGAPIGLSFDLGLERRARYQGVLDFGDDYSTGRARLKYQTGVGDGNMLWTDAEVYLVAFDDPGEFVYSSNQYRGRLGGSFELGGFSAFTAQTFFTRRDIPDSSGLDYFSGGAEVGWFGFVGNHDLDGWLRVERRDYNQIDGTDDFTLIDGEFRATLRSTDRRWQARVLARPIHYAYAVDDPFNASLTTIEAALVGGMAGGRWTLLVGPEFRSQAEQDKELALAEDFTEWGGRLTVDYVDAAGSLLSVETSLGRRSLSEASDFLDPFLYLRMNGFADISLWGGVRLSLLASADWEWADRELNDNRIYLISGGLSYSL